MSYTCKHLRLQYISKTAVDYSKLGEALVDKWQRGNSKRMSMQQKPKSFAIIGLGFRGRKGSIAAASADYHRFRSHS
jgi:hypothetical protein